MIVFTLALTDTSMRNDLGHVDIFWVESINLQRREINRYLFAVTNFQVTIHNSG
jgi:hypothetical protein